MRAPDECRWVEDLLDRHEADPEAIDPLELQSAAAHLESCPRCGAPGNDALLAAIRDLDAALPDESFFAASAERILAAVRAEPAAPGRREGRVVRLEPRSRARIRWVGGAAAALAAGVALLVASSLVRERGPIAPGQRPSVARVVSVDDVDVDALAASEDAWLVAQDDFFDLAQADLGSPWSLEELSDEELEALEGLFGAAPSVG